MVQGYVSVQVRVKEIKTTFQIYIKYKMIRTNDIWPSACYGFQNNIIIHEITHDLHTSFLFFYFSYLCANYNLISLLKVSDSPFRDSTKSRQPPSKYLSLKLLHKVSAYIVSLVLTQTKNQIFLKC